MEVKKEPPAAPATATKLQPAPAAPTAPATPAAPATKLQPAPTTDKPPISTNQKHQQSYKTNKTITKWIYGCFNCLKKYRRLFISSKNKKDN